MKIAIPYMVDVADDYDVMIAVLQSDVHTLDDMPRLWKEFISDEDSEYEVDDFYQWLCDVHHFALIDDHISFTHPIDLDGEIEIS